MLIVTAQNLPKGLVIENMYSMIFINHANKGLS